MTDTSTRRWILAMLGLALAALLAASALLAWSRLPTGRASIPPDMPLAADKSLGVNADLSRLDATERDEALALMEASGFRWLRHRFPWDAIEPKQGVFDWTVWDGIVEGASRHNLKLIAILDGAPGWAQAGEDVGNPLAPPVESRDFGVFAATFAARYSKRIDHYQVWDEPNIAPHWGAREIDPAAYAQLLREGAIQIHTADPGAVIVAAALAPNVEPGGANMSDLLFLDALYQQGVAEWFDVVAVQPYSFDEPLDEPSEPNRLNWQRPVLLRGVMEAHGDVETAVWAVSSGLTDMQPETVATAVEDVRRDWPWLGPMLWAAWSFDDTHRQYALIDADRQVGPVYEVLRSLASAPVVAWPGVYPADHASSHYEGGWRVTPWGADIGGSGDRLTISFRGTRLDLTVRRGDYRAFLYVNVDRQPANALPRDVEGRAYVVLYDPLEESETVTLARDLPDGEHVAEIVADRGWGQWAIVGWVVSREMSSGLLWLPVVMGLAASVVLGLVVYVSWPHRYSVLQVCSGLLARCRVLDMLGGGWGLVIMAGMTVLVYAVVGTIPSLVAIGLLAVLLFLRPEMGLPLIALALPFYQLGKPLLGKVFSMVEILTILTAVGWAMNRIFGVRSRFTFRVSRLTALDWSVVVLVGVGAISLLWAEHGRVAAREFRTVILEGAIFYGLLRAMLTAPVRHTPEAKRSRTGREWRDVVVWRIADAWVLGGALVALVGMYQWAFGQNLISVEGVWRVRGFYGSPNNLALYLGRVFPLGVAIAAWGQENSLADWAPALGLRRRWAYGAAALVMAAALFLTYSRGAWLLGVPASLLFLAAFRGRRAFAAIVGVLVVATLAVLLIVGTARLTSLLDTTEGTSFFRLQLWRSSWAMIRDHPLLGVGLDNFLYHYRTHYVLPTAWEEFNLSHPHNLVFDFWLRLGVSGLVVLIWMLAAFFRRGWQTFHHFPRNNGRLLVLGLMAGMVNFAAHGLVDNAFFLVDLGFAFMLMLGLVQAIASPTESSIVVNTFEEG